MKNKKKKKILDWFFEDEKAEGVKETDEDIIEINLFQALMILVVTVFFLLWIFGAHLKAYLKAPVGINIKQYIESKIEKNYFENEGSFKNGDFSQGLMHWVSSDGGDTFPDSKNIIELDKKDYHSPPFSARIESKSPATRYHYSKKQDRYIINNAYDYRETDHWLGILPGSQVKQSLWYKGDVIRVAVNCLDTNGAWFSLGTASGPATKQWNRLEINEEATSNARAIMLEITLNQAQGMPLPVVLIDDVSIIVTSPDLER